MTDKTDSKEREAFEAWRSDLPYQGATQLQKEAFIAGFRAAIEQCGSGAAIAEIGSAAGEDAEFGQRAIYPLVDIDGFEYGTKLYARASLAASARSVPLMGKPQEMPDLSALTERGAKAWAGVDAQGLRDGVASVAASAGSEPVAQAKGVFEFWWADHMPNATQAEAWREWCELMRPGPVAVTHPSPQEGMAVTDAMIDAGKKMLHNSNGRGAREKVERIFNAMLEAATSAGSGKGE